LLRSYFRVIRRPPKLQLGSLQQYRFVKKVSTVIKISQPILSTGAMIYLVIIIIKEVFKENCKELYCRDLTFFIMNTLNQVVSNST
jgi:hypothetical protein